MTRYDPGRHITGGDWLCLHRNENLFVDSAWSIRTACSLLPAVALSSYPDPQCMALREALADLYGISPLSVYVSNGSDGVLSDVLSLLRRNYDSLHVLDVSYKVYPLLANRLSFTLRQLTGNTFNDGTVDPPSGATLAAIDSPNAITGARVTSENLAEFCQHETSFCIWDNCYGEFADDQVPTVIPKNMMVVRTFSKFYALAGLRIGYCIANQEIVDSLLQRKDVYNVNSLAQCMALEALKNRDFFRSRALSMLSARQSLMEELRGLGFQVRTSWGNFILVTHPHLEAATIQSELEKQYIMVRRFADSLTSNYLRITVPPAQAIERLLYALRALLTR